ncbi:hypothetical protein CEQ28_013735 [Hafnia alvei]|nr:hypothetical protein CEQ28_013735 [Hafnia alvei]
MVWDKTNFPLSNKGHRRLKRSLNKIRKMQRNLYHEIPIRESDAIIGNRHRDLMYMHYLARKENNLTKTKAI